MTTPSAGQIAWRLQELERKASHLEEELDQRFDILYRKLDRLMFAVVGGALTVAVSAVVFTLTVVTTGAPNGP
jgi:type II secretory pathway component PulF